MNVRTHRKYVGRFVYWANEGAAWYDLARNAGYEVEVRRSQPGGHGRVADSRWRHRGANAACAYRRMVGLRLGAGGSRSSLARTRVAAHASVHAANGEDDHAGMSETSKPTTPHATGLMAAHGGSRGALVSEREWAEKAPIFDVVLAAILRGLDGYPDGDTARPQFVLAQLQDAGAIPKFSGKRFRKGITVGELRRWAERKFGDT